MSGQENPIRIGILGAARIAPLALVNPAKGHTEVEVAAVAARDASRGRAFAAKHRIPRVHESYDALIADPDLNAVYIPLPNGLHGRWTRAALAAGKHVLCEKPFTANAAEAREIAELAANSDRVVMEAFHYRYHPLTRRVEEIIASGELGALSGWRPPCASPCRGFPTFAITIRWPAARRWTPGATRSTWSAPSAVRHRKSLGHKRNCTALRSTAQ